MTTFQSKRRWSEKRKQAEIDQLKADLAAARSLLRAKGIEV